jgi:hypothetical protein
MLVQIKKTKNNTQALPEITTIRKRIPTLATYAFGRENIGLCGNAQAAVNSNSQT